MSPTDIRASLPDLLYERYRDGIHYPRGAAPIPPETRSAYLSHSFDVNPFATCAGLNYLSFCRAVPAWDDLRALRTLAHFSCESPITAPPAPLTELLDANRQLQELSLSDLSLAPGDTVQGLQRFPALRALHLSRLRVMDDTGQRAALRITADTLAGLPMLESLELEDLDLSGVALDVSVLPRLQRLVVRRCRLDVWPRGIGEAAALRYVDLSDNPLGAVPEDFLPLPALVELDLSRCGLRNLPSACGQWSGSGRLCAEGNPFETLPAGLLRLKKRLQVELRHRALYDDTARARWQALGEQPAPFRDFGFKLMVVEELMYRRRVLQPCFDVHAFVAAHSARRIDLESIEACGMIPEVKAWFEALPIPQALLEDLTELTADGGDTVYGQISPRWGGEDDFYLVHDAGDAKLLPQLERVASPFLTARARRQLEKRNIEAVI